MLFWLSCIFHFLYLGVVIILQKKANFLVRTLYIGYIHGNTILLLTDTRP